MLQLQTEHYVPLSHIHVTLLCLLSLLWPKHAGCWLVHNYMCDLLHCIKKILLFHSSNFLYLSTSRLHHTMKIVKGESGHIQVSIHLHWTILKTQKSVLFLLDISDSYKHALQSTLIWHKSHH